MKRQSTRGARQKLRTERDNAVFCCSEPSRRARRTKPKKLIAFFPSMREY